MRGLMIVNPKIYRQADSRWGSLPYPTKSYSFAGNGCGCCACLHNIIEIPKYENYTPKDVRPYMVAQGFATKGHGTTWDGITKTLEHYGMKVATPNIGSSMKDAWELLNKKDAPKQGVLLFRAGTKGGVRWTSGGHYVAFLDYRIKDGKHWFYTKDSGGRKHDKWFCYETTMRGLLPKIWIVTAMPQTQPIKVISPKPSATYTGTIPSAKIVKDDTGDKVKSLQKFLNWYGKYGLNVDGKCGNKTINALKSFQKTEGLTVDGVYGSKTYAKAKTYKQAPTPTPTPTPTPKPEPKNTYTGKLPTDNNNVKIINGLVYRYCYPYGTKSSKYKYKGGKPRPAYTKAIDESYPNHNQWSSPRQRKGACCDVLVGVSLRHIGIKVSQNLATQLTTMPKMSSQLKSNGHCKASEFKMGDVVQRGRKDKSGHTWIVFENIKGEKYVANAHYKHLHGCYACMDAKPKTINPKDWKYYKCYTPQGAIRTTYRKGDYGYDVVYIQKFLAWCGYDIKADGDFGAKTESALKSFQKKVGLKEDGVWGATTQAKAKAYTRVSL